MIRYAADLKNIAAQAVFFIFFCVASASAFEVRAEPASVMPGDAFIVKISGAKVTDLPEIRTGGREIPVSAQADGSFIAIGAVDLSAQKGMQVVYVKSGGITKKVKLKVNRPSYPVIHLTLPDAKVSLSDTDMERVERDDRLLKALWSKQTERMWRGSFSMPLGNEISTQYGAKRIINKTRESIHRGIDVRGREGEAVKAVNSGRVVVAEELFFGGNTLVLDHGLGIYSVYMHLSGFDRLVGDDVAGGDVIGFVGSTGRSTGPHLHFGIKAMELSVNPVSFMKLKL